MTNKRLVRYFQHGLAKLWIFVYVVLIQKVHRQTLLCPTNEKHNKVKEKDFKNSIWRL
jgi:hypothetical protein